MNLLKRKNQGNFVKLMIGERCEYMLIRYITILKQKVLQRQEEAL